MEKLRLGTEDNYVEFWAVDTSLMKCIAVEVHGRPKGPDRRTIGRPLSHDDAEQIRDFLTKVLGE